MRRNLFWKLALTFFALLLSVLLAEDFFAERALRKDYERAAFAQLATLARFAQTHPPELPASPSAHPENLASLHDWARQLSSGGTRVAVIASDGQILAVTAIPDEKKGERLVVIHTLKEDLLRECLEKLSKSDLPALWKPRPDQFLFVEKLPYLGTGKLDLRKLREIALAGNMATQ